MLAARAALGRHPVLLLNGQWGAWGGGLARATVPWYGSQNLFITELRSWSGF